MVTFNRDVLLERALFASGTERWSYLRSNSKLTLLKPHGSVAWYDAKVNMNYLFISVLPFSPFEKMALHKNS